MSVHASVVRLRSLATLLPRPGCDWEDCPTFAPSAPLSAVAELEAVAGFELPGDYRAFLAETGAITAMSVHNGYWLGGAVDLVGLIKQGDFPQKAGTEPVIPIATDGGGNAFLLAPTGRVWRWQHETGKVTEVAGGFAAFLDRVAEDWEAYIAETPGWQFLV
jgi:hypothetical protein